MGKCVSINSGAARYRVGAEVSCRESRHANSKFRGGKLTAAKTHEKTIKKVSKLHNEADYYAYNAQDGGFVLMLTDGDELSVIGYSVDAKFSFDNMPEALQEWMTAYKELAVSGKVKNTYPTPTVTPVAPIIKTKWGQREPFNRLCPKCDGSPMLAGCTAVAMAQILNHYKSDATGYDKLEYVNQGYGNKELSVDFTKIHYDWANMLDTYEEGQYTDAQAEAVAKLMYEAGVSCMATYDSKFTGLATSAAIPYVGFNRYYNYNCEMYYREYTPTKVWMSVIQNELAAGRPVLYSGNSGIAGHAFVVDGIDSENNMHINWGWNGVADGYYDITFCRASNEDSRGYRRAQEMLVGLRPRTSADAPYKEAVSNIGYAYQQENFNYLTCGCITTNSYSIDKKFQLAIGLEQNGEIKYLNNRYSGLVACYPSYNNGKTRGITVNGEAVADGTYEFMTYYREYGSDDPWIPIPPHEALRTTVTVKDNKVVSETGPFDSEMKMKIMSVVPAAELIGKTSLYLTVTCKEETSSSHQARCVVLKFIDTETGKEYENTADLLMFDSEYDNLTQSQTFCVTPTDSKGFRMPGGSYKVEVSSYYADTWSMDHDIIINVKPEVDYPILNWHQDVNANGVTECYWGTKLWMQNPAAQAITANKVDGKVNMSIYATSVDTGEEVRLCTFQDVAVPSSEKSSFCLPNSLYPLEGLYELSMRYSTPDGERGLLNPNVKRQQLTILPSSSTSIPQIAATVSRPSNVDNLPKGEQQTLRVPVTNKSSQAFSGNVVASFYREKDGKYMEVEVSNVEIAANGESTVSVPVTFPENGVYAMQISATPPSTSSNMMETSFVTAPNGAPFVCNIGVGVASVSPVKKTSLRVYPNPAQETFRIIGLEEPSAVEVVSAAGTIVKKSVVDSNTDIAVDGLPSGVYFVKANQTVLKLVKN